MNNSSKFYVSLATMAMCAVGFSQGPLRHVPKPVSFPVSQLTQVEPVFVQKIKRVNGQIVHVGPKIPYISNKHTAIVGKEILDVFEGNSTNGADPDAPTDGRYGETWFPSAPGERWYFGSTWCAPAVATDFLGEFPGQAGKAAVGFDETFFVGSTTDSVEFIDVFTANDKTWEAGNTQPPADFNSGVELDFGTGIPFGGYYTNVDLSGSGITIGMPPATQVYGWYLIEFGDPAGYLCVYSQSLLWGTKPLNGSAVGYLNWYDGDGSNDGSQTGTLAYPFTYDYAIYGTVQSYVVNKGTEKSTHNNSNLSGTPGQDVVIQQKLQSSAGADNAQLTATIAMASGTTAGGYDLMRGWVTAKANAVPLNGTGAEMRMYMLNNSTGNYDVVDTISPIINAGADGTLIGCPTVGSHGSVDTNPLTDYLNTTVSPPTVGLRFGTKNAHTAGLSWNMTVNYMNIQMSPLGPDPIAPAAAFSTPN